MGATERDPLLQRFFGAGLLIFPAADLEICGDGHIPPADGRAAGVRVIAVDDHLDDGGSAAFERSPEGGPYLFGLGNLLGVAAERPGHFPEIGRVWLAVLLEIARAAAVIALFAGYLFRISLSSDETTLPSALE